MSCSVTKVSPAAASLGLMNLLIYHRHFAHTYAPQGIPDTAYEYILHILVYTLYVRPTMSTKSWLCESCEDFAKWREFIFQM